MSVRLTTLVFGLVLAAGLALALLRAGIYQVPRFASEEYARTTAESQAPLFQRGFVFQQGPTPAAHSGTLVELTDGGLLAAWFGGSREGAGDVAIYAARWNGTSWSRPYVLTDRPRSQRELGRTLRKLGNPVLARDAKNHIWLFYVTVSVGGWSTSSISYKLSEDDGRHWSPARRLVTSPFINISTLVRARPLRYQDGGLALPVYHELAGKFGELLRLDARGRVLAKARIGAGRSVIQPSVVADDALRASAFLRRVGDSPPRVMTAHSRDGGGSWSVPEPTNLPNPNASVAALRSASGGYLMAYNHSELGRAGLSLADSPDGSAWHKLYDLEQGDLEDEFSYPYLIRTAVGEYHLIYTWQRQRMAHVRFNDAWVKGLK